MSKLKMTTSALQVLWLVNVQTFDFGPTFNDGRASLTFKQYLARLPVHLIPSMERMQVAPLPPERTKVYVRPSMPPPVQLTPSLVPPPDLSQPTIRLTPPDSDSPIRLLPATISPDKMPIRLGPPSIGPTNSPIQLKPSDFESPSFPFPTIKSPK